MQKLFGVVYSILLVGVHREFLPAMASHGLIRTEAYSKLVKRHVLIIGRTGSGKSTIVNMLVNNGYSASECNSPNAVGHGAAAGTTKAKFSIAPRTGMFICDTIGFGDRTNSEEEIIEDLRAIYKTAEMGISCIIVVAKCQRWSMEDVLLLDILDRMFESNWPKQAILVLTHYEGDVGNEKEALATWCDGDERTTEIVKRFKYVLPTNNGTSKMMEPVTREHRRLCIERLVAWIQAFDTTITVSPASLIDVLTYLIARLKELFGFTLTRVRATFDHGLSLAVGDPGKCGSCGECCICLEDIPITAMAAIDCGHQYHSDCISAHAAACRAKDKAPLCPQCRQSISVLYL
eukprot:scpid64065/ scgid30942/ 